MVGLYTRRGDILPAGRMAYPTNPSMRGKGGEAMAVLRDKGERELRTLEDLIWEVERGARKIVTRMGPYCVQVYRVQLAGGPVIRVDLKREEAK